MPRRRVLFVRAIGVIISMAAASHHSDAAQVDQQVAAKFQQWGDETLAQIEEDFRIPDEPHYRERAARRGDHPRRPVYNWGAGVHFSALAAAARVDPSRYMEWLEGYAEAMQDYWVEADGIGGYDVLPVRREVDRYYDDNEWIVLALIETHDLTDDPKHLKRARAAMRFVLSGEDETLGGGIYWREKERNSKNACSNAPAIVAACRLHQLTGDPEYLAAANRLYQWTKSRLRDPDDGLYWDNVRLDGDVDGRKYTYNSAQMVRANCLLYEITNDSKYLQEAQRMAQSAVGRWIDVDTGAIDDSGRFGHMLLESLAAVDQLSAEPQYGGLIVKCVEHVHDALRDDDGRYPARWERPRRRRRRTFQLIDQASVARAYFFAAALVKQREAVVPSAAPPSQ